MRWPYQVCARKPCDFPNEIAGNCRARVRYANTGKQIEKQIENAAKAVADCGRENRHFLLREPAESLVWRGRARCRAGERGAS